MAKNKTRKSKDNNEQELKIDDLNLNLEVDQWELIVKKTYNTVKNETQYKKAKMSLDKFQRVIFTKENNKMLDGESTKGMKLDWQKHFIEPMYQTFIDSVNIILYYFISYYLIRF